MAKRRKKGQVFIFPDGRLLLNCPSDYDQADLIGISRSVTAWINDPESSLVLSSEWEVTLLPQAIKELSIDDKQIN